VHQDWPALAFDAPTAYSVLPESIRQEIAGLSSDFCVIRHPEQTDRFIRASLTIKVNDHCEDLDYGVWVSLSEQSFTDYTEHYGDPGHEATYFGWLSNDLPEYGIAAGIPTDVITRPDGLRPELAPHEDCNHQLVRDYYEGITKAEAERRKRICGKPFRKEQAPGAGQNHGGSCGDPGGMHPASALQRRAGAHTANILSSSSALQSAAACLLRLAPG
jgi:hypothetical protein